MLRLKVALLIRIISRQRQYMKSEAERESRSPGNHRFQASLWNCFGKWNARLCARIRSNWDLLENQKYVFLLLLSPPSNGSVQRTGASWGCIAHAVHRLTRDGRVHAITRADSRETREIVSPGVKIVSFFACTYSLSSCVEKSIERWKTHTHTHTSGNIPMKLLIYWKFKNCSIVFYSQ